MIAETAPDIEPKARIFISYSRKDMAFADRLEAALKARGFEPLIDRTEIYAFEDWWKRIQALIGKADTVVFVLSPDAVASEIALKEVAHAASLNKRFAPIVSRRVEDRAIPEALQRLNFIFFDDPARFNSSADRLAEALRTDIGWIRNHTELGEAARRWAGRGRPGGLLLRSPALEEAERWIASRPQGAPEPTAEMQAFIAESRRGSTRRRNTLTASLGVGLTIALILAGLAYWQRGLAIQREIEAVSNQSAALTALSSVALGTNQVRATKLALAAWPRRAGDPTPKLDATLAALGAAVGELRERKVMNGHAGVVRTVAFSRDGTRIVTGSADKTARIWDADTGRQLLVLRGHTDTVTGAVFSPDGTRVATASADQTAVLWDIDVIKPIAVMKGHDTALVSVSFSFDGTYIVTADYHTVRIWEAATGRQIKVVPNPSIIPINYAAFSPDGTRVVAASGDRALIFDLATEKNLWCWWAMMWAMYIQPCFLRMAPAS